jgi:acetyl-CoA carboxylase biotin carboxyl carrier protein
MNVFPESGAQPEGRQGGSLDLKELKEILQILEEKEIAEFELEEEGMKLRIRKSSAASSNHAAGVAVPAPFPNPVANPAPPLAAAPAPAAPAPPAKQAEDLVVVRSPMVGTFFRAADPNSPPFVNTGDRVKVGQVLCIIEAMKLMNEIEAEVAGEIAKVHHENGQPVQYGEALFSIRPER